MNPGIDELLNSFLDGELSAKEAAYVQQLVGENKSVAKRLRDLEQCRLLVSSLPPAEPPAEVVSKIKQLLHSKLPTGLNETDLRRGTRHLLARHLLAALLMFGILGLFAAVIYKITSPMSTTPPTVAVEPKLTSAPRTTTAEKEKSVAKTDDAAGVGVYSLQLTTSDYTGVDAFVNKILDESSWLKYEANKEPIHRSVYRVVCSRTGLETLVSDLSTVWSKFDSTTLIVHTDNIGQYVAVESVRPEQIADIVKQNTPDQRLRLAKDFAVSNDIEQLNPDKRMLTLANRDNPDLMTIPRPALTSAEKRVAPVPENPADRVRVDLTIVLSGRK